MDPELFTPDQVAVKFGITRSHLYKLRLENDWPHHMLGGSIRFSQADIDGILALTAKTPAPPRRKRSRLK